MSQRMLRVVPTPDAVGARRDPVDPATLREAARIVEDVRHGGEPALRAHAERLGDISPGAPLVLGRDDLSRALTELPGEQRALLERTADRVRRFAQAQMASLSAISIEVDDGHAGHWITPVERAGCYAPGGRFPLPSSVLMTAVTARTAGVGSVIVASPRPGAVTLGAAAVAGADAVLAVGGAHAIAALAFGIVSAGRDVVPACDVVVGPGNRWVTAGKQIVAGRIGIDMLAGPSELVVIADDSADPSLIAADLLAQAEHDEDAFPALIALDDGLIDRVERELAAQLGTLPTARAARAALSNGFAVRVRSVDESVAVCDRLAPEHVEVMTRDAEAVAARLRHFGAVFIGAASAEVLGDYGAGPNHVLPTGGSARYAGGLSVLHFLRVRTWLRMHADARGSASAGQAHAPGSEPATTAHHGTGIVHDAAALARLEGLEAHARAAERRARQR